MSPLNGASGAGQFARPNWIEVDLAAIPHNIGIIRRLVGPETRIFATLKANGYGFGLLKAAKTVESAGADAISLVALDDAVRVRQHGTGLPILVFGGNLRTVHQTENCPTILSGRGAGVKLGHNLVMPTDTPLCNTWLTLLHGVGVQVERHGDSTGLLKEIIA